MGGMSNLLDDKDTRARPGLHECYTQRGKPAYSPVLQNPGLIYLVKWTRAVLPTTGSDS